MGTATLLALAGAACSAASSGGDPLSLAESPRSFTPAPAAATQQERVLGPFLSAHWKTPVAVQGPVPDGFSEADALLDPAVCGSCHPRQYADWKTSLHAGAFSPGFAGQLIEGALAAPAEVRQCPTCHAPLGEQQPWNGALEPEPSFDPVLRRHGLTCAGCHVRAHVRYGPPRRDGVAPPPGPVPHAGFEVRHEYTESRFCASCHQFFDEDGVNGKPIENTYAEWRESRHASEGRSCQSCHMPDRAHLWRGIHDAEMVRGGVEVALVPGEPSADEVRASLVLVNRGVGHAFPTYVTPRIFLAVWQADAAGEEISETRVEAAIGREVDFAAWEEVSDTRVMPDESVKIAYARPRAAGAVALVGRVTVDPDFHYRGVFEGLLPSLESDAARAAIAEALQRSRESSYVLTEIREPLPGR